MMSKKLTRNQFKEEYVLVNGIEHYLLHYPKADGTPVLLFLHGGPGNVESLFAYALDEALGDMFTHVHWDQRGAGKTLRRNKNSDFPENAKQMLDDLHGIIKYIQCKYQTQKIVLVGHSWGTLLGSLYALKHPENVLVYVGVSQAVNMMENERVAFQVTLKKAKKAGNQKHIQAMRKLGNYPPSDPELMLTQLVKLRKIQEVYESGPKSSMGKMLKTMRRSPIFQWGDLASFMRSMKVNRLLVLKLLTFNIKKFSSHYEVPVHYIMGDMDTVTPMTLAKAYYETIVAPRKTFTIMPETGHLPMRERPEEFAAALRAVRESLFLG